MRRELSCMRTCALNPQDANMETRHLKGQLGPCVDVTFFDQRRSVRSLTHLPGWQKLCKGTKGLRRKIWTQTKILSPKIRYFVAIIRFVEIYALFGNLWAKKCCFVQVKNKFSWARNTLLHGIYCIFYQVELANLQLRAKRRHQKIKYALDESF